MHKIYNFLYNYIFINKNFYITSKNLILLNVHYFNIIKIILILKQKLLISVINLMKYISKIYLICLIGFVFAFTACTQSHNTYPQYSTPSISKHQSVKFK